MSAIFCINAVDSSRVYFDQGSIIGRVVSVRNYGIIIGDVKAGNKSINGNVIIYTDSEFAVGDIISTYGDISPIEYDYDDSYINSLYDDNIYHMSNSTFTKIDSSKLTLSEKVRENSKNLFNKYLKEDSKGILYGMLFGDTSLMNDNLKQGLAKTGINHIFAVSGLHIGFLVALIMWINKKLKIKGFVNAIITLLVLIFYNILCGYSPSMIRASIMAFVVLIGGTLGLKNDAFSRLCLAGIIVLLFKPLSVFTVSFQLSFLAVFGLIAFGNTFKDKLTFLPSKFASIISASLAVNFAIFPLLTYHFNTFSLVFLPVNLIILPILPLIYSFSLILTILNLIAPSVNFLFIADYLLAPIKLVTLVTNEIGFSVINVAFNKVALCLYLLGEGILSPYIFIKNKHKYFIFGCLILLSLIFILIALN